MAISSGYFNSSNGDRKYNAETMSRYFSGILSKGVLANYLSAFNVTAAGGMNLTVGTGRAYFTDGRWMENDTAMNLVLNVADVTNPRIDRVVLRKDSSNSVRGCSVIVKTGTPAASPTPPTLESSDYVEELSLAQIYVSPVTTSITQTEITDERPNDVCGFVHGLIKQITTEGLFEQYQATFEEWFNNVVETVSTKTLVRQYYSHYVTSASETEIPVNIPQYNPALDVLNVYINGLRLSMDVDYTRDINDNTKITLTEALDAGQTVDFQVLKSIDGSEAETVTQQVYELQTEVNNMNKFTYYATGTDDNIALSNLVQSLLASAYAPGQITVEVVGHEFGVSTYVSGAGSTSDRFKLFNLGYADSSDKRAIIDFSKCERILIQSSLDNVLVFVGQNVTIKNLTMQIYGGNNLTVSDNVGARFENCSFIVNGSGTVQFAYGSCDADNCDITVTSADGAAYCFAGSTGRGVTLQRIRGGKHLAYTASGSSVAAAMYQPSGENNVLLMTNCHCPITARSGYRQSNTVRLNSGKYTLLGNVLGAAISTYSQTAGTETGTIITTIA